MNIDDPFAREKAQCESNIQTSIEKLHCATRDALDELHRDLTWELTEDYRETESILSRITENNEKTYSTDEVRQMLDLED
ncbi:MAG: hypothetical protein OXG26_12890 [Caldilineaceae bacterium]|nr:hypothetical protein [Caldilineaceae bacterium]